MTTNPANPIDREDYQAALDSRFNEPFERPNIGQDMIGELILDLRDREHHLRQCIRLLNRIDKQDSSIEADEIQRVVADAGKVLRVA